MSESALAFGTIALGIYLSSLPDEAPLTSPDVLQLDEDSPQPTATAQAQEGSVIQPPASASTPAPTYRLSGLRSRFLEGSTVEIWGRTTAPDGTTIRLYARADGGRSRPLADIPAAAGRFYAKQAPPHALLNRSLEISARILG